MSTKKINSRITHKHGKASDWEKATNFIPLLGEIIIYDPDESNTNPRFKVGDGVTKVNDLVFTDINKANSSHTHTKSQITDFPTSLPANGGNADTVDGKHASDFATATGLSDLKSLVGDTSVSSQISSAIASKSDIGHTHDDRYYTETEINNKLSGKSDTSHTHSLYVNQNAFSNVKVGSSTIAADSATDTLTLTAGNNITLTADTSGDGVTIAAKDTTYSNATTSAAGLMSSSDKTKLDGIATGATKVTVDSALSSTSTNPVQNKAVNSAISNLTTLVGDKSVASQISTALTTANSYTDTKVAGLVDSAPETLDTLNELSAALGNDPNFATTVANQIGTKADANHTHKYAGSSSAGGAANSVANSMTVQLNGGTTEGTNKFTFNGSVAKSVNITPSGIGAAASSHTHNYAGSSSAGGSATSAVKLDSSAGDSNTPVYFSDGKPVACTSLDLNTSGNAATATKATQDGSGNNIVNTYATKTALASVSDLVGDASVSSQITSAIANKADKTHTHNYAGSSSAGGSANSAVKLDSSAGSATQPVYFSSGKPAACTYTLEKSVPSDAVFTDTNTKVTQSAVTASSYTNWRPLVIGSSNDSAEGFSPSTVTDSTYTVNTISCQPSTGTIKANTFKGSVKESYLDWGGKNFSGSYGPIDAAMVPELGANRLAFMPANGVEVQYSTDGGSTWSTYSTSDTNKINLFNGNSSTTLYIGASSATGIDKSKYQLRVIITTDTAKVYTALNKFVIYCSTGGSSGSWCTIDGKTKANVDSGTNTWTIFANKVSISGWSGYNVINTASITTYGNQSAHYQKLRFTFGVTSHSSSIAYGGLSVIKIMGFGGNGWTTPSTMARTGRMYTYDSLQNVNFPAKVTATSFSGNLNAADITSGTLPIARGGTGATTASAARTNLGFSDATFSSLADLGFATTDVAKLFNHLGVCAKKHTNVNDTYTAYEIVIGNIKLAIGYATIQPTAATTSTYKTINYGCTFNTNPYVFISLGGAPQINTLNLSVNSTNTSNFQAHIYASNTTSRSFRWLAIGDPLDSECIKNLT